MKSVQILAVRHVAETNRFEVVKEIIHDDDRVDVNLHVFHAETLECKAAEYDIDDIDTLIDLVLLEPFLAPVDVLATASSELRRTHLAAVGDLKQSKARSLATRLGKNSPASKLAGYGVGQEYIDVAAEDPYEVIKRHAPFEPETIAVRRAYVEKVRRQNNVVKIKREDRVKDSVSGTVRADAVRRHLFRQENMRRESQE